MSPLKLRKKFQPAKKALKSTFKRLLTTLYFLNHHKPSRRSKTPHAYVGNLQPSVHINDLFSEHAQGASKGKEIMFGMNDSRNIDTIEDAWKIVVAKNPQLHVDEKAEEFIKKFYEDMKLQKERSLLEFQEMLARSS